MPRKEGQFIVEDYFLNMGGLNTSDSPFVVQASQATDGVNFDYVLRGGIRKRPGHPKLNSGADSEVKSQGISIWNKPGTSISAIRAAGTRLQAFDLTSHSFTNLTEDTSASGSSFLSGSSSDPVVGAMFNTPASGVLWQAGGGMASLYGAYSATKVTKNGVPAPTTSSFTVTASGTGGTLPVGTYWYTLVFRKASTQALSNAGTDATVITTSGQKPALAWTLTNNDTTKYDKIYIYRSSVGGSQGFTAGALVATVDSTATSYTDDGTELSSAENVPRAANTILDNSVLPSGTYKSATVWKQRLVTASGSTYYISDLNKPESFPVSNSFQVPSGGDITGLAVLSYNNYAAASIDEILCIFKQRELWVVTGSTLNDWQLKFIDNSGCSTQALVVSANGHLAWVSYRGIHLWNGSGKPGYVSRPVEDKFQSGGDIDKSRLNQGFGVFCQKRNEIQWYLSSKALGAQKYVLKLDLRLTLTGSRDTTGNVIIDGVFTPDLLSFPCYAGCSFIESSTSQDETLLLGDDAGFVYNAYSSTSDGGLDMLWQYVTPFLNGGSPNTAKRVHKVVAWVLDNGVYNLTLDFWGDYRYHDSEASSSTLAISDNLNPTSFVWDVAKWDAVAWDTSSNRVKPLTFNLTSSKNNSEGDAFRLRFSQTGSNETVILYGFSVYYTEIATRK